jgi:two-component system sensor histidine kinase KdpD
MTNWQEKMQALSAIQRYALSVLVVACALGIRLVLHSILADRAPYMLFLLAVVVVARLWGRGPGLFATVLGGLATWYFILEPRFSFAMGSRVDATNLAFYFIVGAAICLLA